MADADTNVKIKLSVEADKSSAQAAGSKIAAGAEAGAKAAVPAKAAENAAAKPAKTTGAEAKPAKAATHAQLAKEVGAAIAEADRKLASFRSAAAEKMRDAVKAISSEVKSGDLGDDLLGKLNTGLKDFLSLASKLPPKEFGPMQDSLKKIVGLHDNLTEAAKRAQTIDFKVDVESADAIDDVRRKIEAIESAKEAIATVYELGDAIKELPTEEAQKVSKEFEALQKVLTSGDLGKKNIEEAGKRLEALAEAAGRLDARSFQKTASSITDLKDKVDGLATATSAAGDKFGKGFDLATLASSNFGISVGENEKAVASLITKLPGLGKIGSAAFGAIGLSIAAVFALINRTVAAIRAWKMENIKADVEHVRLEMERISDIDNGRIRALERLEKKQANQLELMKTQRETLRDMADIQARIAKAKIIADNPDAATAFDRAKEIDDATRSRTRKDRLTEIEEKRTELEQSRQRARQTIENNERVVARLKENSKEEDAIYSEVYRYSKSSRYQKGFGGRLAHLASEVAAPMGSSEAQEIVDNIISNRKQRNTLIAGKAEENKNKRIEIDKIEQDLKNLEKRKELIEAEIKAEEEEAEKARIEEERRREDLRIDWAREQENVAYDEKEATDRIRREQRSRYAHYGRRKQMAADYSGQRRDELASSEANLDKFTAEKLGVEMSKLDAGGIAALDLTRLNDRDRRQLDELVRRWRRDKGNVREAEAAEWDLKMQGDEKGMEIARSRQHASNRLVALGLAGGGNNWQKNIAADTKSLNETAKKISAELHASVEQMKADMHRRLAGTTWQSVN